MQTGVPYDSLSIHIACFCVIQIANVVGLDIIILLAQKWIKCNLNDGKGGLLTAYQEEDLTVEILIRRSFCHQGLGSDDDRPKNLFIRT